MGSPKRVFGGKRELICWAAVRYGLSGGSQKKLYAGQLGAEFSFSTISKGPSSSPAFFSCAFLLARKTDAAIFDGFFGSLKKVAFSRLENPGPSYRAENPTNPKLRPKHHSDVQIPPTQGDRKIHRILEVAKRTK